MKTVIYSSLSGGATSASPANKGPNARRLGIAILIVAGLLASACSDDAPIEQDNNGIVVGVGSDAADASDISQQADAGNISDASDAATDARTTDANRRDAVQTDVVEQADGFDGLDVHGDDDASIPPFTGSCEQIVDLGILSPGAQTIEFTFDAQNDFIKTSCSPAGETTAEKIYKFTLNQPLDVATSGGSNITVELRSAPCGDETSVLTCNPDGDLQKSLAPGVDYYLLVEPQGAAAGGTVVFELEATSPFQGCRAGSTSCVSADTVEVCEQGGVTAQYQCPDACDSQSGGCAGNSCAAPIVVNATTRVQGSLAAFSNQTTTYMGCPNNAMTGPIQANGPEVVFSLPGLTIGQTIDVETSQDSINNVILIQQEGCGAQAVCVTPAVSDDETAIYTVAAPGDYTVVIDSLAPGGAPTGGSFAYQITLR
jgi:hypothetical protein